MNTFKIVTHASIAIKGFFEIANWYDFINEDTVD